MAIAKQKDRLSFRMEKIDDVYQLFFYDEIQKDGRFNWNTWDYEESETSAEAVKLQLDEIPDGSTIEVHVNSPGGEVGEGVTIYNLLKQKSVAGNRIIGYVDGYAYSVAMNIVMACDEIHMGLGTTMLLHYPWAICSGNADELRTFADQLDALGSASVQLYMARAKDVTEEELREMMRKETILDPETCLKYGFCDVVDKYEKKDEEPPEEKQTIHQLKQAVFACQQAVRAVQGLRGEPEGMKPFELKAEAVDCGAAAQAEPTESQEEPKQNMCTTFIQAIRQMSEEKIIRLGGA